LIAPKCDKLVEIVLKAVWLVMPIPSFYQKKLSEITAMNCLRCSCIARDVSQYDVPHRSPMLTLTLDPNMGGRSRAHNPEVAGSSPAPAINWQKKAFLAPFFA